MAEDHPVRVVRTQQMLSAAQSINAAVVPPPYAAHEVEMFYLYCRFDPDAVRAALPPELEPVDDCTGVIMLLSSPRGWVITPLTACVAGLEVKGYDAADGFPAHYVHTAFYSGVGGDIFRRFYNDRARTGDANLWRDGDRYFGEASFGGREFIRVSARRTERTSEPVAGMNQYLTRFGSDFNIHTTSWNTVFRDLEDVSIDILDNAPEPLRSLKPVEIVWPIRIDDMSMTFNTPRPLRDAAATTMSDMLQATVYEILTRLRRAAALLTRTGKTLFLTPEARLLLGPPETNLLSSPHLRGRRALTGAIGRTIDKGIRSLDEPILLEHPSGRPVFAQVLPMLNGIADEPVVLVLFGDPTQPGKDPLGGLQLLGLTPAEARLAAEIGRGRSPEEAAAGLEISVNTARSTLKAIYSKLDITRQSQLGRLVAKLEML